MSSSTAEKANEFSDVEIGPLLERKPKNSIGEDGAASRENDTLDEMDVTSGDTNGGKKAETTSQVNQKRRYGKKTTTGNSSGRKIAFACLLYSFCSVGMVLTNKSLASSYNHLIKNDLNILLVVIQAVVAVICVEFCKKMKWVEYPSFDVQTAKQWAPVNLLFCGMLFTGMASLQHNTVPMVTVFKNITNIVVTAGDYYFFGTAVETLVKLAFGVMLAGACMAAVNDVHITPLGVFWMAANCLTTAGYVLYMKFATKTVKLSKFGMVFYNNVLCTLFLLPAAMIIGDVSIFLETHAIHTPGYFLKNFWAGFVGFFLNFASLNCVSVTGPSTYAIIGSLNKVPTSIIGWYLFDSEITGKTWFFIFVSMFGGFLYSFAKIRSGKRRVGR
mmetsp:Transcript_28632/g.42370  ORF Transcript_28632/g.42370 Transcript_28632/m.42370 type:complete len:387 (+) Transcript_28632:140-1300(+)